MRKIVIAADIFPPESGGPATYAVTLANELTKRGYTVVVVSLNPQSDSSRVSCTVETVSTSFKPFRYWQYYRLLMETAQDADVIYAMGPVNAGYPAFEAAKKLKKKFVVKVVGDYAWEQWQPNHEYVSVNDFQNKPIGGKIGFLKNIERKVVRVADAVIVPSKYLKKIVHGWGASESRTHVIYNAVEFKDVAAAPKPQNEKWIVSAGRLVRWKGMDTLISLMPEIKKAVPNVKLKIIGDGPEIARLKSITKNNAVELLGNLPRENTLSVIKAADVFVLNSGYEGLSHVLLEAQHAEVPILASRVGGNVELLDEQSLFAYNDKNEIAQKIVRELQNPHHSFLRVNNTMVDDTIQLLETVCPN